jgi:modulator of FtsH protease
MVHTISETFSTNSVLKKTFMLLGATLAFSALMAYTSMTLAIPFVGPWVTLGVYFVLLFGIGAFSETPAIAIPGTFALTGWLGFTTGPILNFFLTSIPGGTGIILLSLALTAITFLVLSGYVIITGESFTYLGGFLGTALLVAFIGGILALIFHIAFLSLIISGVFVILSSGVILFQISEIIEGGETSYIMATITLFVSLYNIFISLLQIIGVFSDD